MSRKFVGCLVLTLVWVSTCLSNDGAYLSQGGVFYPINETEIILKEEVLTFDASDGFHVNVEFTFLNPGSKSKSLLVGFQSPRMVGDACDICDPIYGFQVEHNGIALPWDLLVADCEDCPLEPADPEFKSSWSDQGVFVRLFLIEFEPGENYIHHSYSHGPTLNSPINYEELYGYILTTGAKWGGGKIGQLKVNIDMGSTGFSVYDCFSEEAVWTIVGDGKVSVGDTLWNGLVRNHVRVLDGYLEIREEDFNPGANILFGFDRSSYFDGFFGFREMWLNEREMDLDGLNFSELRLLRNSIYAAHGVQFKSRDLQEYFGKQWWYVPVEGKGPGEADLSAAEVKFIEEVRRRERLD